MTDHERDWEAIALLARRAGLTRALADFPDGVAEAAESAAAVSRQLEGVEIASPDSWPIMRVPDE